MHLSSEYVFDGRAAAPYTEDAPVAPLSAYGASKAAGDLAVGGLERHYLVRPTWVVGDGRNFVRTMLGLAARGVAPTVVADQIGRPTFATDIAAAIVHLLESRAPYGTYHVTGGGEPASWADVARAVFAAAGHDALRVTDTTTAEYFAGKPDAAPRPLNSVLDCTKAAKAGVDLPDWRARLAAYVRGRLSRRTPVRVAAHGAAVCDRPNRYATYAVHKGAGLSTGRGFRGGRGGVRQRRVGGWTCPRCTAASSCSPPATATTRCAASAARGLLIPIRPGVYLHEAPPGDAAARHLIADCGRAAPARRPGGVQPCHRCPPLRAPGVADRARPGARHPPPALRRTRRAPGARARDGARRRRDRASWPGCR